jgi:hypothetical protein
MSLAKYVAVSSTITIPVWNLLFNVIYRNSLAIFVRTQFVFVPSNIMGKNLVVFVQYVVGVMVHHPTGALFYLNAFQMVPKLRNYL